MNEYENVQRLDLTFESPRSENGDKYLGYIYETWFVPPSTGNYRFYQTCDDVCDLKIGQSSPGTIDDLLVLLDVSYYSDHRDWWDTRDTNPRKSDWVYLTEGQNYYLKGQHKQNNGGSHMAVAVEIEMADSSEHHHAMKEIQEIKYSIPIV